MPNSPELVQIEYNKAMTATTATMIEGKLGFSIRSLVYEGVN
jgi:hypothetical protein